jgi:hypothetical protein
MAGADQPSLFGEHRHELAVKRPVRVFDGAQRDLLKTRDIAPKRRDSRANGLPRSASLGIKHLRLPHDVHRRFLCRPVALTELLGISSQSQQQLPVVAQAAALARLLLCERIDQNGKSRRR